MPRSLRPLAHLWGRIGLRGRILLAFVLLMTVTALAYAWAVIRVVEFTEEELMTRGMTDESVRVEQVLARGRTPKLQDGWALYLDPVPGPAGDRWRETTVPPMPEAFREAHDGFSELLDPPAFLYKRTVVAGVIAVTLDQARFEAQEIWIMRFTWASVFVVLAVSLVVGGFWPRRCCRRSSGSAGPCADRWVRRSTSPWRPTSRTTKWGSWRASATARCGSSTRLWTARRPSPGT